MEDRIISLTKGREISLEKGIKSLKVSVEWSENKKSYGSNEDFDIDLIIIELDERGKAISPDHLVFYGSQEVTDDGKFTDLEHAIIHSGDDRDGSGDGEECICTLSRVNKNVKEIVFFINIYEGINRNQSFRLIKNAIVKAYEDGKDSPKLVYQLTEDYSDSTILVFGKLVKLDSNKWKFVALGDGYNQTLFQSLNKYGLRFKESNI